MEKRTETRMGYGIISIKQMAEGVWDIEDMNDLTLKYAGLDSVRNATTVMLEKDIKTLKEARESLKLLRRGVTIIGEGANAVTSFNDVIIVKLTRINYKDDERGTSSSSLRYKYIERAEKAAPIRIKGKKKSRKNTGGNKA